MLNSIIKYTRKYRYNSVDKLIISTVKLSLNVNIIFRENIR